MYAHASYSYTANSVYQTREVCPNAHRFVRALCAYVWRMHPDHDRDVMPAIFGVAEIEARLLGLGLSFATDTGNTHTVWGFQFGAYGDTHVWVLGDTDICDALEAAAGVLPPGMFTEPDYAGAAAEIGETWDPDSTLESERGRERVREHAEADLTHTESGFLASWEWHGSEIDAADMGAYLDDQIARGRGTFEGAHFEHFRADTFA